MMKEELGVVVRRREKIAFAEVLWYNLHIDD